MPPWTATCAPWGWPCNSVRSPPSRRSRPSLAACSQLAQRGDAESISTLGPALVGLIEQMEEAGALPATAVMRAWAVVVADVGAVVGQVGLALALDTTTPARA